MILLEKAKLQFARQAGGTARAKANGAGKSRAARNP
jgi:hypothetical protein